MFCPRCQHENPDRSRFCGACGARFDDLKCGTCGALLAADQAFCHTCGAPVSVPAVASFVPYAERRQITVMFCDLIGSTELSERLDPDELREVIRTYQHTAGAAIVRFEGHVAQYLGDGLLVAPCPRVKQPSGPRGVSIEPPSSGMIVAPPGRRPARVIIGQVRG